MTDVTTVENDTVRRLDLSYDVSVTVVGVADLLFKRWSQSRSGCVSYYSDGCRIRPPSAGSDENLNENVYRNEVGEICLPGKYLSSAITEAARYRSDPQYQNRSARNRYRVGIHPLTSLASLNTKCWDYVHVSIILVQGQKIRRTRPAFKAGWRATVDLKILDPEQIPFEAFSETMRWAGQFIGVGDFRPNYGRFAVETINQHAVR